MGTMIPAVRLARIRAEVARRGIVSVRELTADLGVTEVTIRRDFAVLEQEGVLRRTRGGALSPDRLAGGIPYHERRHVEADAKAQIGRAASALVEDGDTIFLSSGTTSLAMARCLAGREHVTIVTNSVHAMAELLGQPGITLISTGGSASAHGGSLTGPLAEAAVAQFRARKAFIGCSGITQEGISNASLERAALDRRMIEAAAEVYVLADHTKFGRLSLAMVADLDAVTAVITDVATPGAQLALLEKSGVKVTVAPNTGREGEP